jgi:hypothetical protein
MQTPEPQEQHRWLHQLVGEWTFEHECNMGPDQPPMKCAGKQSTRALGELWIIGDITSSLPDGSPGQSVITLGFDIARLKFVGTFIASCMTHLWPYEGSLDASGKVLTLDSEGPSFSGDGTMARYQDIIEILDRDHHTMTSRVQSADGTWTQFMHGTYCRSGAN